VAGQPVVDTLKETPTARPYCARGPFQLWSVQTPQTFRVEVIRRAIAAARAQKLNLTDDTAACELIGQPVRLVKAGLPTRK